MTHIIMGAFGVRAIPIRQKRVNTTYDLLKLSFTQLSELSVQCFYLFFLGC